MGLTMAVLAPCFLSLIVQRLRATVARMVVSLEPRPVVEAKAMLQHWIGHALVFVVEFVISRHSHAIRDM